MVTRWCVSHGRSVPTSYARCYPGCSFCALAAALLPRPRPRPRPWLAARGAAAMTAAGGGMFAGPLGWRTGPRPWLALRPRPLPPLRVCVCGGSIHGFDILRHVGAARPTRPTRPETGPTASLCEIDVVTRCAAARLLRCTPGASKHAWNRHFIDGIDVAACSIRCPSHRCASCAHVRANAAT